MPLKFKLLLILLTVVILPTKSNFDKRINESLHGGKVSTTAYTTWQLYKYRDVALMRKSPMCWCPFRAYLAVRNNVKVYTYDNKNWIEINTDLYNILKDEAEVNRKFAQSFKAKGNRKQIVRKIYKYCKSTEYKIHVKYASNVFKDRQGDCAGIASAFYVLCKAKGIPVRYVIGWDDGYCHAWNRVKIDGKWYWIDATCGKWLKRKQYSGRTVMEIW